MMYFDAKKARELFSQNHPSGRDDKEAPEFYSNISRFFSFEYTRANKKIAFIIVAHRVHTLPYFIEGLFSLGTIAALIPKSSRAVPSVILSINKHYHTILRGDIDKEILRNDAVKTEVFLRTILQSPTFIEHHFIILDHGGYFTPRLKDVLPKFSGRILGIVEHTLNGELSYKANLPSSIPIFSIASTDLKACEDFFVAESIVSAIQNQVYGGDGVSQYMPRLESIMIIGYGHMGRHVALLLREKCKETEIYICDKDPDKVKKASSEFFMSFIADDENKRKFLPAADLVITATSSPALTKLDFALLKTGACIACVTSRDSQFEKDALADYEEVHDLPVLTITQYQHKTDSRKVIYLAANGGSVNFLIGSTPHPILHAVLASVCVNAKMLTEIDLDDNDWLTHITPSDVTNDLSLQKLWEEVFKMRIADIIALNQDPKFASAPTFFRKRRKTSRISNASAPCPNFAGRETFIQDIATTLETSKSYPALLAISGYHGMGKTQVIKKYIWQHQVSYSLIWWFNAKENLFDSLARLAKKLEKRLNIQLDNPDLIKKRDKIRKAINQFGNWLLIFDDAEDYLQIKDFIPTQLTTNKKGHVLITSNNPHWPTPPQELQPWTLTEACQYISTVVKDDSVTIEKLAKELDRLPIAIVQAIAAIKLFPCTITQYLELYQKKRHMLRIKEKTIEADPNKIAYITDYNLTTVSAFDMNYEKIQENILQKYLLFIIAFLAPHSIDTALLKQIAQEIFQASETEFEQAIRTFTSYSILNREQQNEAADPDIHPLSDKTYLTYSIHKTLQDIIHEKISEEERKVFIRHCLSTLHKNFKIKVEDKAIFQRTILLAPHVEKIIDWAMRSNIEKQAFLPLLIKLTRYFSARDLLQIANKYLTLLSSFFPPTALLEDNPAHLELYAKFLMLKASFASAKRAEKEEYDIISKEILALLHSAQLNKLDNKKDDIQTRLQYSLGLIYSETEQTALAKPCFTNVLTTSYFLNHPIMQYHCRANIGTLYLIEKNYSEAIKYFEQTLSLSKDKDPNLGYVYNSLGYIYRATDNPNRDLKKSEEYYRLSIAVSTQHSQQAKHARYAGWAYEGLATIACETEVLTKAEENFKLFVEQINQIHFVWPKGYQEPRERLKEKIAALRIKLEKTESSCRPKL